MMWLIRIQNPEEQRKFSKQKVVLGENTYS